jgi:hypothetical protein
VAAFIEEIEVLVGERAGGVQSGCRCLCIRHRLISVGLGSSSVPELRGFLD